MVDRDRQKLIREHDVLKEVGGTGLIYIIDTESERSKRFRNLRARGCSNLRVSKLHRSRWTRVFSNSTLATTHFVARGFPKSIDPIGRSV